MTRTQRKYTIKGKEALINRMLPPENCLARVRANETRISPLTLATWKTRL